MKNSRDTLILVIERGKASLVPPIGPTLGQYGIPGTPFCDTFNQKTKIYQPGTYITVKITLVKKKIVDIVYTPNSSKTFSQLSLESRENTNPIIPISNLTNNIPSNLDYIKNLIINRFTYRKLAKGIKKRFGYRIYMKTHHIIKKSRRKKQQIFLYNYIYIQDIYAYATLFAKTHNVEQLYKSFIHSLSSHQLYFINRIN